MPKGVYVRSAENLAAIKRGARGRANIWGTIEERFWKKVHRSEEPDECWLWIGKV